jgi:hypothetical protein
MSVGRDYERRAGERFGGEELAGGFVDALLPEDLDWRRLVRRHPVPSLLVAALGGYLLGRRHGPALLAALSGFAAAEITRQVTSLADRESF